MADRLQVAVEIPKVSLAAFRTFHKWALVRVGMWVIMIVGVLMVGLGRQVHAGDQHLMHHGSKRVIYFLDRELSLVALRFDRHDSCQGDCPILQFHHCPFLTFHLRLTA
jgi:hypothetical protein